MLLCSSSRGSALFGCLWVVMSLLLTMSFSYSDPERVEVVGMVECTDCKQMNIMNSQAFSGLRITVDCKFRDEESKVWGMVHPNGRGKFKVSLPPPKIVSSYQKMKEELDCTANVHNAFGAPCPPVQNQQLKSSKIIFFNDKGKNFTVGQLARTLKFSLMTCGSKSVKPFSPPPAPFYKSTLLSQAAAHTVYIPRPPSFPTLYPPLPQPVPDLEPMTPPLLPPPVPCLEPTTPPLPSPIPHLEPTTPLPLPPPVLHLEPTSPPPLPPPVPHLEPTTPPLPSPFPHLEPTTPPLPSPVPRLEPTTPPPAPTLENPFPPPNPIPAQSPPSPAPTNEKPDPFPPVGEALPPPAAMSNELPPPPIPAETLKPPTNARPLSPTFYEPSLPPAYCC